MKQRSRKPWKPSMLADAEDANGAVEVEAAAVAAAHDTGARGNTEDSDETEANDGFKHVTDSAKVSGLLTGTRLPAKLRVYSDRCHDSRHISCHM